MDVDQLKSGELYRMLKESHVIFICLEDIFRKGLARYTFENLCIEDHSIKLNDRSIKHFFVTKNYDKIKDDKELRAFLKMLQTGTTEDTYTRELERYTEEAKQSAQTRRQYMEWDRALNYAREDGYDTGYNSGYGSGVKNNKIENAAKLLQKSISPEIIAECTGLSLEEVEEIKNSLVCAE